MKTPRSSRTSRFLNQPLGFDIGGANIKLSDGKRFARHQPFELWKAPDRLVSVIQELVADVPPFDHVAITMTGELTDCFANKKEGVEFIVDATSAAFETAEAINVPVIVYLLDGSFVTPHIAKQKYELASASNWHALTKYVSCNIANEKHGQGTNGILVDSGSTTTDLIPFSDGKVMTEGCDDFGRLVNHELVYTGSVRSSLSGIIQHVEHRGQRCPVMNECFATTLDTNIVLGHLPEGSSPEHTADGGPSSIDACIRRMARLVGKDELTFNRRDAEEIAKQVFQAQTRQLVEAAMALNRRNTFVEFTLVVSGQGEFLARALHEQLAKSLPNTIRLVSIADKLDENISSCATAWCIANLANEHYSPVSGIVESAQ